MDRLGLGYAAMSQRNPRLVYCSISGYGQQGPSRDEAAMDLIVECSSGFMSITGTEDGELVRSGYAVADINVPRRIQRSYVAAAAGAMSGVTRQRKDR